MQINAADFQPNKVETENFAKSTNLLSTNLVSWVKHQLLLKLWGCKHLICTEITPY